MSFTPFHLDWITQIQKSPLSVALIFYILTCLLLLWIRPRIMFEENGNLKHLGTNLKNDETLLPLWLAALLVGIFVYCCRLFTRLFPWEI
tara:strand:+ start:981 stop:1250 length:270 start_codon:yes stop_codon:yes gene_type:complete